MSLVVQHSIHMQWASLWSRVYRLYTIRASVPLGEIFHAWNRHESQTTAEIKGYHLSESTITVIFDLLDLLYL